MKIRLTAVILSALFAMGFAGRAYASDERGLDDRPNLTVRGEALLKVPADQMHLNIAAVTHAETAALALDQNTALMQKVIQALKKIGLTEDEYQTGQFQIEPVWSQRPRQAPEDWRPRITGYTVTNRLAIKTKKLPLAGKLIGAATDAGANAIDSIFFDLADPRKYRGQAIQQATANALADARSLADAASVKLVRVLTLSLDNAVSTPFRVQPESFAREAMAAEAAAPPISSGEVTVQAGILLVYEIGE